MGRTNLTNLIIQAAFNRDGPGALMAACGV